MGTKFKDKSPGSRFSILNEDNPKRKRDEGYQTGSFFTKKASLADIQNGPKFVLMKREEHPTKTMTTISPFTVQKSIETFAGNPKNVKLLRDGSILIETNSRAQAEKLYNMKNMGQTIKVAVEEHPTLNTTKGTIYCKELLMLDDKDIEEGFSDFNQQVIKIDRIKRRKNGDIEDTGIFVLTFNLPVLPLTVRAGYLVLHVKLYIPNPRRCLKCQKFGHGQKYCNWRVAICAHCAVSAHTSENCQEQIPKCRNCEQQHPSWSRECQVYLEEKEIQKIQAEDRISNFDARKKFRSLNPFTINNKPKYNEVLKQNTNQTQTTPKQHNTLPNNTSSNNASMNSTSGTIPKTVPHANKTNNSNYQHQQSLISNNNQLSDKIHTNNNPNTTPTYQQNTEQIFATNLKQNENIENTQSLTKNNTAVKITETTTNEQHLPTNGNSLYTDNTRIENQNSNLNDEMEE